MISLLSFMIMTMSVSCQSHVTKEEQQGTQETIKEEQQLQKAPRESIIPPEACGDVIFTGQYISAVAASQVPIYADRCTQAGSGPIVIAADEPIPFIDPVITTEDITYYPTERIFALNRPGTYLVAYQINYASVGTSSLELQASISVDTTFFFPVSGGSLSLPDTSLIGTDIGVSNTSLIVIVSSPLPIYLRVLNSLNAISLESSSPDGVANISAITIVRIAGS